MLNRTVGPTARHLQGCFPFRECSPADVAKRLSRPPLIGFLPLRRFRFARRHLGCHASAPAPAGFRCPHDAFNSASNLPGVFRPGSSLGFSPSGLFPSPACARLSAGAFPHAVSRSGHEHRTAPASGRFSGEDRHPSRSVTSATGRCPRGVSASPGFSTGPVSPLARAPSQAWRPTGLSPTTVASQG